MKGSNLETILPIIEATKKEHIWLCDSIVRYIGSVDSKIDAEDISLQIYSGAINIANKKRNKISFSKMTIFVTFESYLRDKSEYAEVTIAINSILDRIFGRSDFFIVAPL